MSRLIASRHFAFTETKCIDLKTEKTVPGGSHLFKNIYGALKPVKDFDTIHKLFSGEGGLSMPSAMVIRIEKRMPERTIGTLVLVS